jgi:hypothetical protein
MTMAAKSISPWITPVGINDMIIEISSSTAQDSFLLIRTAKK